MRAVLASVAACVLLAAPVVATAQYDPYFGTYDTPYVDYSSPTWTRTPESVTRPSGSSGITGGTTGGTTTGTHPSSGSSDAASITIPAGATEVWVQPGPDPANRNVFYAPEATVEEPRAAADTTLRKIYVRSPLGKPNYTQPVGAFDTYDKGYVYKDKLSGTVPVPTPTPVKPAPLPAPTAAVPPAPTPTPAVPVRPAPTPPPAQPATPASPTVPAVSGEQPAQPAVPAVQPQPAPSSPRAPVIRRIARGINAFFGGIVRWFQRIGQ